MLGQVWFIIIFVFNTENLGNGSALIWCIFGAHTEDKGVGHGLAKKSLNIIIIQQKQVGRT